MKNNNYYFRLATLTIIFVVIIPQINVALPMYIGKKSNYIIEKPIVKDDWINLIRKNKSYISLRLSKRDNLTQSQIDTKKIIDDKIIKEFDETTRMKIIRDLFNISRYRNDNNFTGFIEDNIIMNIMVEALTDSSIAVRNSAFSYVLNYGRIDMLQDRTKLIISNLTHFDYNNSILLRALLKIDIKEKELILQNRLTPNIVKARLGNQNEEDEIIDKFNHAVSYKDKYEAAQQLGYIGSQNCTRALINGLSSNLILKAAYEDVSIRYIIIKNLGRVHPQNQLLTVEINKISDLGDERYGGPKAIKNYLIKVSNWVDEIYQIKLNADLWEPIIYKKKLIEIPLKK